jgi:hypothetical protein
MSPYPPEIWTWENCKDDLKSIPGRLGFPHGDRLELLRFEVDLTNGTIIDQITQKTVDENLRKDRLTANTIFYALSAYSDSTEKKPTGKLISSKQFRGAQFTQRDTLGERSKIAQHFTVISELKRVTTKLGGSRIEFPYGDIAVCLDLLPYIPLTIVLTLGDDEFPADVRLFYDETVENYFDSEQTYFLTNLAVSRIIQSA